MKTDKSNNAELPPKKEDGDRSLDRPVGLIPCPSCGAGQHPPIPSDGKRAWWNCGSYGIGKVDHQSDVCAEREEHNETKREMENLANRWRKDADQYQRQVDESRSKNLPCEQTVSAVTFLRQCAKELENLSVANAKSELPTERK